MVERFRLNEPAVSFEEIDGEVVAINFDNGHYHTLSGAGAEVFGALVRGYSASEMLETLPACYDADRGQLERALRIFLEALQQHALVVPDSTARPPDGPAFLPAVEGRAPFTAPILESFDDMEHFLLLDPIHEVDETGWPRVPVASQGDSEEGGELQVNGPKPS